MTNSESISAAPVAARAGSPLWPQVKALVWEEIRTGGAIAAACLAVGLVCLIECKLVLDGEIWLRDTAVILMIIAGVPVVTALLLILRTDYSGHMVGGYSERVMRLPVPLLVLSGVPLVVRTLNVLVCSAALLFTCHALLNNGPGLSLTALVVALYLCIQTLDWLRAPLSGLSSLLLAALGMGLVLLFLNTNIVAEFLTSFSQWSSPALAGLLVTAMLASFVVSTAAVFASRAGRSFGVPEMWHWPQYISYARKPRSVPFKSPLSAQVWHDLQHSMWTLPGVTLLIWVLLGGSIMVTKLTQPGPGFRELDAYTQYMNLLGALLLPSFLLGACVHGISTRVRGFRASAQAFPSYFMNPLTSSEMALARMLANAAILTATLAALTLIHFLLMSEGLLFDVLPAAFRQGHLSFRETLWSLGSRAVLAGLLAWPLMAIGTRLVLRLGAITLGSAVLLTIMVESNILSSLLAGAILALLLAAITSREFAIAWRRNRIPARMVALWTAVWSLTAWLLLSQLRHGATAAESPLLFYLTAIVTCVGVASLVPLPYFAFVQDIHHRRHSGRPDQGADQHKSLMGNITPWRNRLAWSALAVFCVWLGWPGTPGYVSYLHGKGYPASFGELENRLPAGSEKQADPFRDVTAELFYLLAQSSDRHFSEPVGMRPGEHRLGGFPYQDSYQYALSEYNQYRDVPLPPYVWGPMEYHWNKVTSKILPDILTVCRGILGPARYEVSTLTHTAQFDAYRRLSYELQLDAYYHLEKQDSAKAIEDTLAQLALALSLAGNHSVDGQWQRMKIYDDAVSTAETILMRAILSDADLQRLGNAFDQAAAVCADMRMLSMAQVGDSLALLGTGQAMTADDFKNMNVGTRYALQPDGFALIWNLLFPVSNERMFAMEGLRLAKLDSPGHTPVWSSYVPMRRHRNIQLLAPRVESSSSNVHARLNVEHPLILVRLHLAQVGIAAERYRLDTGAFPDEPAQLVPNYLPRLPDELASEKVRHFGFKVSDDEWFRVTCAVPDLARASQSTRRPEDVLDFIPFTITSAERREKLQASRR
ncbi:MAG: hypothetical protein AMXMBFR84_07560 [Candidatus Hydrogenedentota bacterium]